MDSLLQEHTPKRLRKALAALPQGENSLRETYDEAMKRVESQGPKDQQLAKRVLAFICYTKKPLSKEELQHALSVEDGDEDPLDGESLIPEGLLTSLCAGLVTVDEAIGTIRFVHYTTQEYFEVVREDRFPDAQLDMARTCLTYLRLESFDVEVRDGTEGVEDLTSQYPFLGYASLFWGHHVRDAEKSDDEQLSKDVMDFFDHKRNFNSATRVLLLHPSGEFLGHLAWYHPKGKAHFHLLNVAAYFGLDAIVSKMLGELNVDDVGKSGYVDSNDGFLGNALHWASIGDHEHVLKRLLNLPGTRDIINVLGPEGETSPLHQAIIHRRAIPIKLLLEHGADIYQRRGDYAANSCLELALHTCPLEIIKLLFGADKERKLLKMNQFMNTSPFHTAAGLNYSEALQLMLDLGDEVYQDNIFRYQDIIDNHTRCPLHVSAEYGATDTTRVLLRHRLSNRLMAVRDRNGANPFHLAITQGGVAVTKTFLDEKGILLLNERIGSDGGLHIAASRGEPDVVGLLLDHAPISYYVNEDKSVLHSAARSGSAATVKVVLDKAGNWMVEHPDSHRRTPLHDAAMQGHIEVVQVLLSNEANPNALDDTGKTPLHFAAMGSFDKLVKLLVNAGSRLELKDLEENTALLLAMKQRAITSVHALLKLGAKMPELDEDLQAWASAQPWWNEDGRFSSHLADYYPETSKDVFQAADDLQEISKLPRGIVHVILDKAEYWLRSDAQRAEQHLVNDYHGDLVYLQSQPITGKVQRIIFTITSHDQGWSDHAHDHGTYNGSWTWFSAWKLSGPNKTQGPEILRNMHARREPNTLHVCWPWRDGYHWHSAEGPESEALQNEWIRKLKEGDRVLIVAKAKYPGWTNFVIRAEISIFTSVI
ncbi:MAG: hypothetical protein M1822_002237 [Bathelium mastoideum]|nr:MAG: hypothetical protein M1822_002237 [Bathelium mastoideum]